MAIKYIKNIIFSQVEVTGIYRYKDEFQIYPINIENAPKSKNANHFPLIIEYQYNEENVKEIKAFDGKEDESVNEMISKTSHQTNRLIEITNLLSTISNFRFFFYRNVVMSWTIPIPEENNAENREEINNYSSNWSAQLYYYKNIVKDLQITAFSTPEFKQIELIPRIDYYWYEPMYGNKKEVDFPNNIDRVMEKYFALSADEKKICNSSLHQFSNGLDLFKTMKSLSFFSFVSCIETLVNYEFRNDKVEFQCNDCKSIKSSSHTCNKCGKPIWGISAKFREFLFKYVASSIDAKKLYNKIYTIRSQITHTGFLLSGDNFLDWDFTDKTEALSTKHAEAMQLCRRSVSNWLILKE
ncbi:MULTISPECIES: hypothetical protein [unclassified Flavobacterium]|uniref:hypothetical protein n=1 Tax=unclassified Flavobacterium TaxID=196869 RepID=UPI00057E5575|nr:MULTISPECIES: hypothetical protein [unclassified Flavobacterium]KIA95623.1 hypothetical protein OA93_17895 [Flavobacterium sp. KMS]OUL63449.1 hypothetical protein B8T70_04935 [Flavobacterium sp. AJR]